MSEITLILGNERYTVDRQLLIEHSEFVKTLLEEYPDKKEFNLTFPIKSLNKFVDYMNGRTTPPLEYDEFPDKKEFNLTFPIKSLNKFVDWMNGRTTPPLDYDEFLVHKYLNTKSYFDHLIYLMVEEGPNYEKIRSPNDDDLSWEIYTNLPLNMIPKEMLTDSLIESYKTKSLPNYPKKIRITRNEKQVKTELLLSNTFYIDGPCKCWYENGQMKEDSNWLKGDRHGLYQLWYEDGKREEVSNWLEGYPHGLYQLWYKNGERREVSNWLRGRQHGLCELWHENGEREEVTNWFHGKQRGLQQKYENGKLKEESFV